MAAGKKKTVVTKSSAARARSPSPDDFVQNEIPPIPYDSEEELLDAFDRMRQDLRTRVVTRFNKEKPTDITLAELEQMVLEVSNKNPPSRPKTVHPTIVLYFVIGCSNSLMAWFLSYLRIARLPVFRSRGTSAGKPPLPVCSTVSSTAGNRSQLRHRSIRGDASIR